MINQNINPPVFVLAKTKPIQLVKKKNRNKTTHLSLRQSFAVSPTLLFYDLLSNNGMINYPTQRKDNCFCYMFQIDQA